MSASHCFVRNCPKPLYHNGPHQLECCCCGIDFYVPDCSNDPDYYYYQPRNILCGLCALVGYTHALGLPFKA